MHKTAYALVIVGAVNWGLVGLFGFNLVSMIFGTWPMLEKLIYILVGLSAIYEATIHMSYCNCCSMEMGGMEMGMTTKMSAKKKKRR